VHQPGVAQRWREHLIASPFGTIHAATFSMPSPLGTRIPHPPLYALANFDPMDVTGSIGAEPLGDGSEPLRFPSVNRATKRDALVARKRQPLPPLPPLLAVAPAPQSEILAALRKDDGRFDAVSPIEPPATERAAQGERDAAHVFFGAKPLAPAEALVPWGPGGRPSLRADPTSNSRRCRRLHSSRKRARASPPRASSPATRRGRCRPRSG
jgi:hypothetical protein